MKRTPADKAVFRPPLEFIYFYQVRIRGHSWSLFLTLIPQNRHFGFLCLWSPTGIMKKLILFSRVKIRCNCRFRTADYEYHNKSSQIYLILEIARTTLWTSFFIVGVAMKSVYVNIQWQMVFLGQNVELFTNLNFLRRETLTFEKKVVIPGPKWAHF